MKKLMKYETPEFEVTRFEVEAKLMTVVIPGGGSDNDKEDPTVPIWGDDWFSLPDLDINY